MLKKIAVTGGTASGKSTVCHVFQELGAYVVSADHIVHQLLLSPPVAKQVVELLGPQIVQNQTIDRGKISSLVFTNPTLLQQLEALMHPLIFQEIEKEVQKAKESAYTLFVAEVPLLFEVGWDAFFDETIAVVAPEDVCQTRKADYKLRMQRQLTPLQKAQRATYVLHNSGSLDALQEQAKTLYYSKINKRHLSV